MATDKHGNNTSDRYAAKPAGPDGAYKVWDKEGKQRVEVATGDGLVTEVTETTAKAVSDTLNGRK